MDVLERLLIDHPVAQAGMGHMAPPALAVAVAQGGGLGTLGTCAPAELAAGIDQFRQEAPGRAVAVNLLMPFVKPRHVEVCTLQRVDVAVVAFGGDRELVDRLRACGALVFVMVGTESQARTALDIWGADGLVAQGSESGGHLTGSEPARTFLPTALAVAGKDRPVLLAGGIADAADTRAALDSGAAGVVAGTRFLLTHESPAHPAYQQRIMQSDKTIRTTLFGLGWPAPHRVIANAATGRWCHADGSTKALPAALNARSAALARFAREDGDPNTILRLQRSALPFFSPAAPDKHCPDQWIERSALYAGDSGQRMNSVVSAADAVALLTPR
ncbi:MULTISPECIES: NAD(P)H-dependent flavin oxidoreductase [Mycobacteriaceae]|uniref:Nitronate monooxygenase n=2 Tax=Mycobacteriaceae TaxID=1762 RepID=A0A1A0MN91_MYCMU|nr:MULTISPECIES: nitronate monooxygenase [Mycobacteriaceae]OBA86877.1 oxidoreductase [Mycolicibacterium mucogenicum]OHU47511.1 oxidoreductase [Mycobacteroides chelonae]TDK92306.1 nitronate monooxygenase [Mycolicibacterium mucogenicum]SLI53154.1 Oxidoreductase, 2-nitropropane dioxygenase family protein [Mycobacteroides abscessus subsp. abscessus]SLJ11562.1 Oxidoreductase, 2-nitropropane dioxygenase family protein [Mycobacteroides abscessus subsp. abscessus]